MRSGRRKHDQKTDRCRIEERKEKSTKQEFHCEELAKISATDFTLDQREKRVSLWKFLGWRRASIFSDQNCLDSEDNMSNIHGCISLLPLMLP